MRSTERTDAGPREAALPVPARRNIALVAVTVGVVALSFGAVATGAGWPWWAPTLASLLVFAGASQFMLVGILAAGGGVGAAVLAGLLANLRHVAYGLAVADDLGPRWWHRLLGAHLLIDEGTALTLALPGEQRRRGYWVSSLALFGCWQVGVLLGVAFASRVHDPDVFGLDAAFPAALLALLLPSLGDRRTLAAALIGVAVALAATPVLPAGLPVVLAIVGVAAGRWRVR